jgi:hypothetical protein
VFDPKIPEEYHQHWRVFDEELANRFPPARNEDHAITLKPGAPDVMDCKIYKQMEEELKTTRAFLLNHLKKGYINESKSPYVLPMFYHPKKDRKLRPIMDYQKLNSWTIRDTYPLPLISSILKEVGGKNHFYKV